MSQRTRTDAVKDWAIDERPSDAAMLRACVPDFAQVPVMVYAMRECHIIVSDEPSGWHLSISHARREPTWQEIATARYRLLGAVREMAMLLPPLDEYVNLHPFTFHLFENPPRDTPRIVVSA